MPTIGGTELVIVSGILCLFLVLPLVVVGVLLFFLQKLQRDIQKLQEDIQRLREQ